ncbi:MAG: NADH-quinone oxidoreductase subunit M [Planctomyces sp.]|nr:NADH-quinone oxidoreductase subunit M [Planctomyces sp.]
MENWIPLLIALPALAAVLTLLVRSQPALVRIVALGGGLASLLVSLAFAGAYYRFVTDPAALQAAAAATAVSGGELRPVQPRMELRTLWLDLAGAPQSEQASRPFRLEFYLGLDGISISLIVLTAILIVSSILISWTSVTEHVAGYHACLLVLQAGLVGVFCAFDLLLFYVFFEFTLIPLFFLVGIWGGPERRRAAVKLFLYTFAGGLITLVGLAALVVTVWNRADLLNPFSIPDLARSLANYPLPAAMQAALFLAIAAGFFVKVPLFPFHTWLPLAHVEAPTAGSVLLAGVLLKLGTYGFLRLCLPLFPDACVVWGVPLIGSLSVVGIVYGSLCSLAQRDIKKLIAYSSVAHLGFSMLGLFALNREGITGGVLQMLNHGLSTGALFLLVGMVYERYHTRQLDDLGGLAQRLPLLACCMVFISMASIGLPGLNGFVGEFLGLLGMFARSPIYAVIGATGVILGAWYLLTMLQHAFFGPLKEPNVGHHGVAGHAPAAEPHSPAHPAGHGTAHDAHGHGGHGHGHAAPPLPDNGIRDINAREWLALFPLAALCLALGVYPQPLLDTIKPDIDAVAAVYDHSHPDSGASRTRATAFRSAVDPAR